MNRPYHSAIPADTGLGLAPIPLGQLLPWAAFIGLLAVLVIYFLGVEQGALSLVPGSYLHEFVHDGRHLLGFPCH